MNKKTEGRCPPPQNIKSNDEEHMKNKRNVGKSIRKRDPKATKLGRITRLLVERGPYGLDSQEARLRQGDGCLHSTVASFQSKYRINVSREWVTVSGWSNEPTRVMRYWFDDEAAERVQALIREGRA